MKSSTKTALVAGALGLGAWLMSRKRPSAYSFADKVMLITGGSRGLGLALARQLAAEGARLALLAREPAELERAAEALVPSGRAPLTLLCDVTDRAQVDSAMREIESQLGPVDVLINNAGTICVGPLSTMTREDFEESLQIAFWACYNTVEAVLPSMRTRRAGRIVNISSIGGKVAVPHLVPYCVGKFALVGYSHGLRAELANNGITVTTICPGLMRTGSPRNAFFKGQNEAEYAWFKISDSLPLLTVSAEEAAREIIEACRRGDAEAVISAPAQFGVLLFSLFPNFTGNLISLANRLLPRPGGTQSQARLGKECETGLTRSALTATTDRAAVENNELVEAERQKSATEPRA